MQFHGSPEIKLATSKPGFGRFLRLNFVTPSGTWTKVIIGWSQLVHLKNLTKKKKIWTDRSCSGPKPSICTGSKASNESVKWALDSCQMILTYPHIYSSWQWWGAQTSTLSCKEWVVGGTCCAMTRTVPICWGRRSNLLATLANLQGHSESIQSVLSPNVHPEASRCPADLLLLHLNWT